MAALQRGPASDAQFTIFAWLTWSPDAFGTTCKTSKLPGPIPVLHQLMKLAAMWFCAKENRSGFHCKLSVQLCTLKAVQHQPKQHSSNNSQGLNPRPGALSPETSILDTHHYTGPQVARSLRKTLQIESKPETRPATQNPVS